MVEFEKVSRVVASRNKGGNSGVAVWMSLCEVRCCCFIPLLLDCLVRCAGALEI